MLLWFILTIPLALGIILPKRTFWEQYPVFASFYFTAWAAVYFGMLYYGSRQKYTVEDLACDLQQADDEAERNNYGLQETEGCPEEKDGGGQTNKYAKYLISFERLMQDEHLFLQHNLRADELASRMYTNRTYLSRMLREEFQCTFSDYINRKRIEYSQKLILRNPDIKMVDLAEQSGFANINSFGRTFKQIVGIPPKEWLKNNLSHL